MTKAGNKIIAGLREAVAHAEGRSNNVKIHAFEPPEVDVAAVREKIGLSQEQFAASIGIKIGTLRNWEQRHRKPQGPAKVLMAMLAADPDRSMKIIKKVRANAR